MYRDRRITLGSNAFFHQWNDQSWKNFHCKELKAHYLLSQFVMPLFLPAGCASLSSSKEHWHISVFIILGIVLQLPLRTDGTFVSSGFTEHIICTCYSWDRFAHPFFNHHCTTLLLSPKEIGSAHVMFYSLQSEWFSLRLTKHHCGFLMFS